MCVCVHRTCARVGTGVIKKYFLHPYLLLHNRESASTNRHISGELSPRSFPKLPFAVVAQYPPGCGAKWVQIKCSTLLCQPSHTFSTSMDYHASSATLYGVAFDHERLKTGESRHEGVALLSCMRKSVSRVPHPLHICPSHKTRRRQTRRQQHQHTQTRLGICVMPPHRSWSESKMCVPSKGMLQGLQTEDAGTDGQTGRNKWGNRRNGF